MQSLGLVFYGYSVALRKESVDRNIIIDVKERGRKLSLSARRAWIEICKSFLPLSLTSVALRKESVDRNIIKSISHLRRFRSLSARRAWIEIQLVALC